MNLSQTKKTQYNIVVIVESIMATSNVIMCKVACLKVALISCIIAAINVKWTYIFCKTTSCTFGTGLASSERNTATMSNLPARTH